MDPTTLLADVQYVLSIGKIAVAVGADVAPFVTAAYDMLVNKTGLTDAQRASLMAEETALRSQLDATSIPADAAASADDVVATASAAVTSSDPLTAGAEIANSIPVSGS